MKSYKKFIIFILTIIVIIPINSDEIVKMRKKSFNKAKYSFFDSSINPIIFYDIYEDNFLMSRIIVSPLTAEHLSFINKENKYDTEIYIVGYDTIKDEIKHYIVQEKILLESTFYKLNKTQFVEKYFDKNGSIINYDFDPNIREFEYTILNHGFYLRHGCESSSELYIE